MKDLYSVSYILDHNYLSMVVVRLHVQGDWLRPEFDPEGKGGFLFAPYSNRIWDPPCLSSGYWG
jgi:hypothetical protein